MSDGSFVPASEQDPNIYRECFDLAVEAVKDNFGTFSQPEFKQPELLTSIAVGYLVLGETATVETIEEHPVFQGDASNKFDLYIALAKEGDESALEKAKVAGAVAGEHATYLEDVIPLGDTGPLRASERYIRLIEAGATDLIPVARQTANRVELRYRTGLLGSLYALGDEESLSLALQAADDSYAADRGSEHDTNSQKTQSALDHMFTVALNEEKFDDAIEISKHFDGDGWQDTLLIKRAIAGDPRVNNEEIEKALSNIRASHRRGGRASFGASMGFHRLIMGLAKNGHETSLKEIKKNIRRLERKHNSKWRKKLDYDEKDYLYQALYALYEAGDPTASERLEDLARSDEGFGKGIEDYYLINASSNPLEFARLSYANDPNVLSRDKLLDLDFSKTLFSEQVQDEISRLQTTSASWMGRLIVKTARKAANSSSSPDNTSDQK